MLSIDTDVIPAVEANDPMAEAERLRREMTEVRSLFEELRTELTKANQQALDNQTRADRTELELSRFKQAVVEVGNRYAEEHDWCSTYDQIMSDLGLPGRERQHEVRILCHFSQTVYVMATSDDDAVERVEALEPMYRFRPGAFLEGVIDAGLPYDLGFEVAD